MGPEQLRAFVEQHKTAVLGVAAAGVTGFALLHRKRAGEASTSGTAANPNPAAAVVPGNGGGYDSSAYDVYSALQSELGPLLEQQRQNTGGTPGGGVTTAPKPVASTLFAPSGSGRYVRGPNGLIAEVESDGSLFGLSASQWAQIGKTQPNRTVTAVSSLPKTIYSLVGNLKAANPAPAAPAAAKPAVTGPTS